MAVQPAPRYCGRCGAPLAPGAPYCGRCGTPVLMPAAAAPPVYAYPPPPPTYAAPRQQRLAPALIAGGLVVILIVAAVVVGGIAAAQFASGTHSPCVSNCAPKFVTPLAEQASFRSSAFKFQVNYTSGWMVRAQDANGVTLATRVGSVQVVGASGGSPDKTLQAAVSALPSTRFQDVTQVAVLRGAHLGDQEGVGAVYSANLIASSQTAQKVRIAVIAASRGGVTVAVLAVNPADPKNSPNGMPEGQDIDYMCTEFVWG
jgi:zinc-ribbon domain